MCLPTGTLCRSVGVEQSGTEIPCLAPHQDPVQVCWSRAEQYTDTLPGLLVGVRFIYNVMDPSESGRPWAHLSKGISGLFLCLMSVLSMAAADSERGGEAGEEYRFWRGQTQAPKSLRCP